MSAARSIILPPHLQGAKVASAALIRTYGGQEAAEAETGRAQSRFSAYGGRNTPDFIPLDLADALEDRTVGLPGWPHVTRWLVRRRGGVLFFPQPALSCADDFHRELGAVARETGDVLVTLGEGLRDGRLSSPERAAVREEIAQAQERLALLDALLAQGEDA